MIKMVERSNVDSRKEDKRDFILTKATNLFRRYGLEKISMNDIAKECGMGKSSLYYYFKSKNEVFADVISNDINVAVENIRLSVNKETNPKDKLKTYIVVRMNELKERALKYTTISEEYMKNYAFISKIRDDFKENEISIIQQILEEGVQDGIFNIFDSRKIAIGIYYCLKGLEEPIIKFNGNIEELTDNLLTITFNGILTKEK